MTDSSQAEVIKPFFKGDNAADNVGSYHLTAVVIICSLVFAPVLVWSHWGVYSDPHQILELCRNFYSSETFRWDLIQGFYRPGFHSIDILTWLFSKNQPLGFYVVRFIFFLVTICCTYLTCFALSSRRFLSALMACSWLLMRPTYEVIYTLDKAETSIAALISIVIYIYLSTDSKIVIKSLSKRNFSMRAVAIALCALWAMFTKETGQLLLAFGLLLPVEVLVATRIDTGRFFGDYISRKRLYWALLVCSLCVTAFIAYKIYFAMGGIKTHYGGLSLSPEHLINHLNRYFMMVPEFFILYGSCLLYVSWLLLSGLKQRSREAHHLMLCLNLLIVISAATFALLAWNSIILYSWYPLFALLIPAACFCFKDLIANTGTSAKYLAVPFLLVSMYLFSQRFVDAQMQFQLDNSVQSLTAVVAKLCVGASKPVVIGLPWIHPENAELGEEIESLIQNRLVPNYVEKNFDAKAPSQLSFFNILDYELTEPKSASDDAVLSLANCNLPCAAAKDFLPLPGVRRYSYCLDNGANQHWIKDNFREGDILLVPFGDVPRADACYRGTPSFCSSWSSKIRFIPQLKFKQIFSVEKSILTFSGRRYTIGWVGLETISAPQISWNIDAGGNLHDGDSILSSNALAGHSLALRAVLSQPMKVGLTDGGVTTWLKLQLKPDAVFEIDLPLRSTHDKSFADAALRFADTSEQKTAGFIRVDEATVH